MRTHWLSKALLAVIIFVLIYGALVLLLRAIGLENAQDQIHRAGIFAPVLFVGICVLGLILAPVSSSTFFVAGGALFGKESAFALSLLATLIGCSANFWISRKLGRRVVSRFIGTNHLDELDKFIQQLKSHHSIFYITLIMPLSQDVVSYAVGLTRIKYSHFLIALMVAGVVTVGTYVYVGTSLLEWFL